MADAIGLNAGRILFELSIVGRQNVEREIARAQGSLNKFAASLQGLAMDVTLRFSLMNAVIAGFATKAAVDFDKALTNIQRTSGMTRRDVDDLGQTFLELSKTLPTANAAQNLANIGVIAGKLGLESKENIQAFSVAINKLVTIFDNLEPEETATKMAQIASAFNIPFTEIERLGSVISEIDNRSTATTRELIIFTQMTAGTGRVANLTAADLVGMAGAIKDVGLRTEVAATAVNQILTSVIRQPAKIAHTIGITTAEFKRRVEQDGIGAVMDWLAALQKLDRFQMGRAMAELGLRGTRYTNVVSLLAKNIDLLRERVAQANEEERVNLSLTRQWEIAQTSMAAKMNRVTNEGRALAISLGQQFFPVLEAGLKVLKGVLAVFESLPAGVQNFTFALIALLAVAGPLMLIFGNTLKLLIDIKAALIEASAVISILKTYQLAGLNAGLGQFLSLMSPAKIAMLGFAVVAVGAAAAFALFNSRQKEARENQARLSAELDRAIKAEIDHNQAIIRLKTSVDSLAETERLGTIPLGEKERLYREINQLLPGLVDGHDTLAEAIIKVGKAATEAGVKVQEYGEDLVTLRKITIGEQLREEQEKLTEVNERIESELSRSQEARVRLIEGEEQELAAILERFPGLWSKTAMQSEHGLMRFYELNREAVRTGQLTALDIEDLIFQLDILAAKLQLPAESNLVFFINYLRNLAKEDRNLTNQQKRVNELLAEQQGLLKAPAVTPPPPAAPLVVDIEDVKLQAEELKSELALIQAMFDRAQAEISAQGELTDEERARALREVVISHKEETQHFREGTPLVVAYTGATQKLIGVLRQIAAMEDEEKDRNARLAEAVELETRLTRELDQHLGTAKAQAGYDESQLAIRVKILQMQMQMYDAGLAIARFENQEVEYMEANRVLVERILSARREVARAIEAEIEGVLQIGELSLQNFDDALQAAAATEKLQQEERERVLELLRLYGQLRGWTPAPLAREDPFRNAVKAIEKWGVTTENVMDAILYNWRRMNNRLVDMLFESRLNMRDIWEGIAKDFLSMLLDQMLKKGLVSFLEFIASIGTRGIPFVLPELPLAGFGDFLVRKNGQIIRFSEDDSVVGFKSVDGLLGKILPSVVQPGFATVGGPSINFAPTVAGPTVNVPAPNVYIYSQMDGVKFMQKRDREYREWQYRRRLNR